MITGYTDAGADAHQQRLIDANDDHDHDLDTGETVKEAKKRHARGAATDRADYMEMYGVI